MSRNIDMMTPASGRMLKEDNSAVNVAELFAQLAEAIGEKSESPVANTLLALLKEIERNTSNITVNAETVNLNTDSLEALLADVISALVGTLDVNVSTAILEDLVDDIKTALTNTLNISISGNSVAEMKDQDDAVDNVITFSANINSIEIYHSEATPQEFIVNGLTLIIAAGGWRSSIAGVPAMTVGIPTGINCIVARLV